MAVRDCLVELKNIVKVYGEHTVLKNVDFDLYEGEIHCLVGENGAGKSTLMRILSGFLQPTKGEIFVEGQIVHLNPLKAKALGIILIPQELNLVDTLRVYENVFLGDEIRGNFLLNKKAMIEKTKEYLDRFNLKIDPKSYVSQLSPAQEQMVEIVKAISKQVKVLIMDGHPLIGVNFTYPPNMISTAINLAVMALRKQDLNGFYQRGIPRKIILATETVTKENAKDYYFPESVF